MAENATFSAPIAEASRVVSGTVGGRNQASQKERQKGAENAESTHGIRVLRKRSEAVRSLSAPAVAMTDTRHGRPTGSSIAGRPQAVRSLRAIPIKTLRARKPRNSAAASVDWKGR